MSDTSERVWIKEVCNSLVQYGHWYAHGRDRGTEYSPAAHIEQLTATNKELEAKLADLERWRAAAFIAHGNLDLDIEANPQALAELKGQDD
jgi:hypothetical protein